MWERRSYFDGVSLRCTVKFAGSIPPWPDAVALGVEWDEPSRGRNNGELDGVRYFHCQVPGAGSFIKSSRTPETEVSVSAAIFNKYVDRASFTEIELDGGKFVETVGVEKLHKRHVHVEKLEVISLEASRIKSIVGGGPIRLESLQALQCLDLSNNLLQSFDEVLDLVSLLPNLTCLRLNGNRMIFNAVRELPQLQELNLANTLVTESDIDIVSKCFSELRTLSLAQNRLSSAPPVLPQKLATLDLSCNFITELSGLPASLESLFISENDIVEVKDVPSLPKTLDIRGHHLPWESISVLGASNVIDLHVSHHKHQEAAHRPFVIARCPKIEKLNGTLITPSERLDSEMYTLNAVMKKKHPMLPEDVWQDLLRKYGVPAPVPDRSIRARLYSFYIGSNPNPFRIVKDAPAPRLLRQIARATNTPLREVRLSRVIGCRQVDDSELSRVLTVDEIIEDGAHLDFIESDENKV